MSHIKSGTDFDFGFDRTLEINLRNIDAFLKKSEDGVDSQIKWKQPTDRSPQKAKLINPTSRTQLKQQLMRQQLLQQEAREIELAIRNRQKQQQQQQHFHQQQQQQQQEQQQQVSESHFPHQRFGFSEYFTDKNFQLEHRQEEQQQVSGQAPQPSTQYCSTQNQDLQTNQGKSSSSIQQPINIPSLTSSASQPHYAQPQQIESRLENPTKYHVVEKHKRIFRQILNEAKQQNVSQRNDEAPSAAESLPIPSPLQQKNASAYFFTYSDPGERTFQSCNGFSNQEGGQVPGLPSCATSHKDIREYSIGNRNDINQSISPTASNYMSRTLNDGSYTPVGTSSATSITSDVSEVNSVLEEILNLEEGFESGNNIKKCDSHISDRQPQGESVPGGVITCDILGLHGFMGVKSSSSCPTDVPKVKLEPQFINDPQQASTRNDKDRQKKDNHNMIERRRRFNINDRIKELMHLLPKVHERYHENYRDTRHNKGQILTASVSYMKRLKDDVKMHEIFEEKIRALEQDKRLLALRVKELENQLQANGIKVEEMKFDSSLYMNSFNNTAEVMSPTTSPTSSPYVPTPTTSPFAMNIITSSPVPHTVSTGNYTTTPSCNASGGDSIPSVMNNLSDDSVAPNDDDTTNLLDGLVVCESSSHVKKELLMDDYGTGNFGLNLIDDDSLTLTSDPLLSSPQLSSPNSSRHSFEDALTPDSMDIGS